jgi:hypothetical protein
MIREAVGDVEVRLKATATRIAGLRAELYDEQLTRDRQILEAIDDGHSQSVVGRWAQLTEARVRQIIVAQDALAS